MPLYFRINGGNSSATNNEKKKSNINDIYAMHQRSFPYQTIPHLEAFNLKLVIYKNFVINTGDFTF